LLCGVHGGVSSPSGIGLGPACARPGFGAQLLEQPDPLDQSLTLSFVHTESPRFDFYCHRRGRAVVKGLLALIAVVGRLLPTMSSRQEGGHMYATLQSPRWPLVVLLAVFFLALMAALGPGLSELDLSGIGAGASEPEASLPAVHGAEGVPSWVSDPLEPPIRGMERAVATR
jgi:hypothetical protein